MIFSVYIDCPLSSVRLLKSRQEHAIQHHPTHLRTPSCGKTRDSHAVKLWDAGAPVEFPTTAVAANPSPSIDGQYINIGKGSSALWLNRPIQGPCRLDLADVLSTFKATV